MEPVFPQPLQEGDTIGIVAPAGIVPRGRLESAIQWLEAKGYRTRTYRDVYQRRGYLAGTDAVRIAELNAAFADPECRAILPARGGYGCIRIVAGLDYDLIRANPKIFIGFSDNTVLHAALWKETSLVTFHGPHACDGFGRPDGPAELTESWFWRSIAPETPPSAYTIRFSPDVAGRIQIRNPGAATGRLVGGNLALVCSLLGTRYELPTHDSILLLEDVGEPPYRVDRLLAQLKLGGHLDRVAGIVLGQFSQCGPPDADPSLTLAEVLDDHLGRLTCPILANFPCGHEADNVTVPLGVRVELDADNRQLTLLDSPVASTS